MSPASTVVSGFPLFVVPVELGLTIVRTRGELLLVLLSSSAAQTGMQWAAGLAVVSQKAATLGVTAIPGPLTEMDWDGWLWHSQGSLKTSGGMAANTIDGGPNSMVRVPIDSKAMRKFGDETGFVGMLETVEVGTSTLHAELRTRFLVKLS